MSNKIERRDFLKLLSVSPLLMVRWPQFETIGRRQLAEAKVDGLPNILILVFDSLSAKHMSIYGYPRQTTPNIEQAARGATVFHRHYSGGNFTTSGTASLFTGTYPWSHRGFHLYGQVDDAYRRKNVFSLFSAKYTTFVYSHNRLVYNLFHQFRGDIHQLKKRSELCLVSDSYSPEVFDSDLIIASDGELLLTRNHDIDPPGSLIFSQLRKFNQYLSRRSLDQKYKQMFPRGIPNQPPGDILFTLEHTIDWIKAQLIKQPKPFLGYIHLFPPHLPYTTRQDFIDLFDDGWQPPFKPEHILSGGFPEKYLLKQRRFYDEYIAYVDAEVGRLYDYLEQTGALEHTIVILTSDHGEMFERGIWEHITPVLFEPLLHIPLLIWRPGQNQRRDVFTPTSGVDILPTLLHLIGQPAPAGCEGQVLVTFGNQDVGSDRSIYAVEAKENPRHAPLQKASIALIKGRYKLIHYMGYEGYEDEYELYNVETDPEELVDLYPSHKSVAGALKDELKGKLSEVNRPYE